ncbi:MAG: transporter related [Sphingobacteriaceae bacterium]|jgi:peptide/nickel transport system ATP-binding protein|nr:transporter related [Sphingobacteriaceae bacterium]
MIVVKSLSVAFSGENGSVQAVDDVSFEVEKGEVLGIVGESGSGKSVTSLAIMRLHDPSNTSLEGSIQFNDTGLLALSEDEMRSFRGSRIAMIFQEPMTSLNPVLTCGYQVAEAIKEHKAAAGENIRNTVVELFKEVQLPRPEQIYDSYPHQLSGGQKQRVMIAMALSCNPEVLIADEPTTALDVTVQKTIIRLLLRLKEERNMSLIFISHDLGVIGEIADKVLVMYKGKVVEHGTVKQLFTQPQHPYTKGLLACRPLLTRQLERLPVMSDFLATDDKGGIISKNEDISELLKSLETNPEENELRRKKLYSAPPLLQVQHLKTWYPIKEGMFSPVKEYVKAVDDVSFDVYPGETLGLVGESGCGKTTLGRSILRLIEPTGGKMIFKGTDLLSLSAEEMRRFRKHVQIIFQDPYSSLNPRITVGRSIIEPMQVHKKLANDRERKARALELLERVNLLPEHFNRYPHEFSGGQRQRICIARALALKPEFIICDESVSALDVSVQAQVLNLLRELQREFNLTYIFISHDLAVVKHISDRILVMNQGRIEESGDPQDILNNPEKEYTRKLIEAIPSGLY